MTQHIDTHSVHMGTYYVIHLGYIVGTHGTMRVHIESDVLDTCVLVHVYQKWIHMYCVIKLCTRSVFTDYNSLITLVDTQIHWWIQWCPVRSIKEFVHMYGKRYFGVSIFHPCGLSRGLQLNK